MFHESVLAKICVLQKVRIGAVQVLRKHVWGEGGSFDFLCLLIRGEGGGIIKSYVRFFFANFWRKTQEIAIYGANFLFKNRKNRQIWRRKSYVIKRGGVHENLMFAYQEEGKNRNLRFSSPIFYKERRKSPNSA